MFFSLIIFVLGGVYSKLTLEHTLQNPYGKTLSISEDGKKIIVGHNRFGNNITMWDIESRTIDYQAFDYDGYLGQWDIAIGKNVFVTASYNYQIIVSIRIYNRTNGEFIYKIDESACSVDISPDGTMLASGNAYWNNNVKLWDINSGECLSIFKGHLDQVMSVSFSPDGKLLATASNDNKVKIWNIQNEECLFSFEGDKHMVSVSFSSDGKLLAAGSEDETIRIWDVKTGELKNTLKGHVTNVIAVDFSEKNSSLLDSCDRYGYIKLWDIEKGECISTTESMEGRGVDLQFFPNSNYLASLNYDDYNTVVRIWGY